MAGGYIFCEYDDVKLDFPEYKNTMDKVRRELIAKSMEDWNMGFGGNTTGVSIKDPSAIRTMEMVPSGMAPLSGEFGESTIFPQLFRDITNTTMTTWNQWFNATTHQLIMSGANAGAIYEDYKVGVAGLAFLDKAIRVSEIKMQVSDKKLVRMNIEEAFCYNNPAIIFAEGYYLDEETGFDLWAYVLTQGPQRIKLIGLQTNRVPNKLQVKNTGAVLT